MEEAAALAWRKRTVLAWYEQHIRASLQGQQDRQAMLAELRQRLLDPPGPALLLWRLEPEEPAGPAQPLAQLESEQPVEPAEVVAQQQRAE